MESPNIFIQRMMSILSLAATTLATLVLVAPSKEHRTLALTVAPLYYYGNGYTNQRHPLMWRDFPVPNEVECEAPFVTDGIPGQLRPSDDDDRPSLTVMAGPGVSIYAVTGNVVVEQDLERNPVLLRGGNENPNEEDAIASQDEAPAIEDSEEFTADDEECVEENGDTNEDENTNRVQSAIANSALLHRAGLAGNPRARKSGRSSRAKQHVNKRTTSGRSRGTSLQRVVGTVRTAASVAATKKTKSDESDGGGTLKSSIQSSIHRILDEQDGNIQQQSIPTMASIGILGEPVLERLPEIPPEHGKVLIRRDGAGTKPEMFIRSSIPHSSDDTHIANLRLSVFSGFDVEQQHLFRSRSLESINSRRRRGSVILVAEAENEEAVRNVGQRGHMANAHNFGPHGVLVAPDRGAKLIPASTGRFGVEHETQNGLERPSTSGSLSIVGTAECSHQEFVETILGRTRRKGSL